MSLNINALLLFSVYHHHKRHKRYHAFMSYSLQFKFPANLTVAQFITYLNAQTNNLLHVQHRLKKTKIYYDSFDWRLYNNDILCEFDKTHIKLKTVKNDLTIISSPLTEVPRFSHLFTKEPIRQQLEPLLEMRALLPICSIHYQQHTIDIMNEDKKIILHLIIEEYQQLKHRLLVEKIKGYDKEAEKIIQLLRQQFALKPTNKPILFAAIKQQKGKINDYSTKLEINLLPDMPANKACQLIYQQLLNTIKVNEHGVIDDIDSEFLHDFRVAIRRTRTALNQLKNVFPITIQNRYKNFFSWLAKITSTTRDLDVYLLNFQHYKNSLPLEIREHINPLYDFLQEKQKQAQQELAKTLRSTDYVSNIISWEKLLKEGIPFHVSAVDAQLDIKQLANRQLLKSYNRVLKQGNAITKKSPCEALHELRKSCKKLRYLIEFFQNLYPKAQIKALLKLLKELQEVLGDYQDRAVQEYHLKQFSIEMQTMNKINDDTLFAIEKLIENLSAHKDQMRSHFFIAFTHFQQHDFKSLFKSY